MDLKRYLTALFVLLVLQPSGFAQSDTPDRPPQFNADAVNRAIEAHNAGEATLEDVTAAQRARGKFENSGDPVFEEARRENRDMIDRIDAGFESAIAEFRTRYVNHSVQEQISELVTYRGDSYEYSARGYLTYYASDRLPHFTQRVESDGTLGPLFETAEFRSVRAVRTFFNSFEDKTLHMSLSNGPWGVYARHAYVTEGSDPTVRGEIFLNEHGRAYLIKYFDENGIETGEQDYTWLYPAHLGDPDPPLEMPPFATLINPEIYHGNCLGLVEDHNALARQMNALEPEFESVVDEYEREIQYATVNVSPISRRVPILHRDYDRLSHQLESRRYRTLRLSNELRRCTANPNDFTREDAPDAEVAIANQPETFEILIDLFGEVGNDEPPQVRVYVDNVLYADTKIDGEDQLSAPGVRGSEELKITFTNDWYRYGVGDRNVLNIYPHVNGRGLNVIRNTGSDDRNAPGPHLYNSGSIYFDLKSVFADTPQCPLRAPSGLTSGSPLSCYCPADRDVRTVFGTSVYRGDSDLCSAARHDGRIGPYGGSVNVYDAPAQETFAGRPQNGVVSQGGGGNANAFTFNEALAD